MTEEETFEQVGSGASLTYPVQCSSLRKGGFVCIRGNPCKVVDMSTSKTGKHGGAKVHLVGIDIFTGKKYEEICGSTQNVECPNVSRKEYQLVDISGEGDTAPVSLLLDDGTMKEDLNLPGGELAEQIRAAFDDGQDVMVTVLAAMNKEMIVSFKASVPK